MTSIRSADRADIPSMLDIWRRAVQATHHFLRPGDFEEIERIVAESYLPNAAFWLAVDPSSRSIGFMGLTGSHIDSLFIDPAGRGAGVGRLMVEHAGRLASASALSVDVNEQNEQAVGFYRHLGFEVTGRSEVDDAGRPYPILHMAQAS